MLEERIRAGATAIGVSLGEAPLAAYRRYYDLLVEWNSRFNLTRITSEEEAADKHIVDSLTALRLPESKSWRRLCDVGSGAGFPGIVLKIARPDLDVTLIEATGKKVGFLEEAIVVLGLGSTRAIHGRGEETGRMVEHRGVYDVVTARAVAALPQLVEYCLPMVAVGGCMIAYKGPEVDAEMAAGERAAQALGGGAVRRDSLELPGGSGHRTLIIVEKAAATPTGYPRSSAQIIKRPLG